MYNEQYIVIFQVLAVRMPVRLQNGVQAAGKTAPVGPQPVERSLEPVNATTQDTLATPVPAVSILNHGSVKESNISHALIEDMMMCKVDLIYRYVER
jgi:hypothetical protein